MNRFLKQERLKSKKEINLLFNEGNRFLSGMFKIYWHAADHQENVPAKVMISVPSKKIRKAYQRNLLKRRIREAYRKNKQNLFDALEKHQIKISFTVIYLESHIYTYKEIEKALIQAMNILVVRSKKISGHEKSH